MFYIKQFFKILMKYPFVGVPFVLFLGLFIVMGGNSSLLQGTLAKMFPANSFYPHFYTLVAKERNQFDIARKLRRLPGVHTVRSISKEKIKKMVQGSLDEKTFHQMKGLINFSYNGLKIELSSKISTKSQTLIQDYIKRLVGEANVSIGPVVKVPKKEKDDREKSRLIQKFAPIVVILSIGLIWMILYFQLIKKMTPYSYLLERFQRKTGVCFKIGVSGQICIILLSFLILMGFSNQSFLHVSLVLIFVALVNIWGLKRTSWKVW